MKKYIKIFCVALILVGCGGAEKLSPDEWKAGKVNGALAAIVDEASPQVDHFKAATKPRRIIDYSSPTVERSHDQQYQYIVQKSGVGAILNEYKMTLDPQKTDTPTRLGVIGITQDGIPIGGITEDAWQKNRGSGWTYEAFQDEKNLDVDEYGGHDHDKSYHYHGIPRNMPKDISETRVGNLTLVGHAGDGFKIYVSEKEKIRSSWRVKDGIRPSGKDGPGEYFDGTYTRDYEFIAGSGRLDMCNGTIVDGEYLYILTEEFPYVPRCLYGNPDPTFLKGDGTLSGRGPSTLHLPPPHPELDVVARGEQAKQERVE